MGFAKEEIKQRRWSSVWRGIKTLFFLINMVISFLLFSAPILLALADTLLPSALLSVSLRPPPPSSSSSSSSSSPSLPLSNLCFHFSNYDFRSSLIDIPIVSIVRSAVILCVYGLCDGPRLSRGPYLTITMICSVSSLVFVSLKASFVFSDSMMDRRGYDRAMEIALFACSLLLAIGHVVVAYRTSCRERRKLLVYKIDIEAVSAYKNVFPRYQKILKEERLK